LWITFKAKTSNLRYLSDEIYKKENNQAALNECLLLITDSFYASGHRGKPSANN